LQNHSRIYTEIHADQSKDQNTDSASFGFSGQSNASPVFNVSASAAIFPAHTVSPDQLYQTLKPLSFQRSSFTPFIGDDNSGLDVPCQTRFAISGCSPAYKASHCNRWENVVLVAYRLTLQNHFSFPEIDHVQGFYKSVSLDFYHDLSVAAGERR
jgi:hypothetical protein